MQDPESGLSGVPTHLHDLGTLSVPCSLSCFLGRQTLTRLDVLVMGKSRVPEGPQREAREELHLVPPHSLLTLQT